jgi:hypothetical protein
MTLLYTPIDIEFDLPDQDDIVEWFEQNRIEDLGEWNFRDGEHEWALVATGQPVSDWRSVAPYASWQAQGYQHNPNNMTRYAPGFTARFPGLFEAIERLPFREIGVVGMMRQLGEIDEHRDTYDPNEPQEPRRYLLYLTDPHHNTFWVRNGDQRRVVDIPDQTRVFAFNNSETTHGALPPTGEKILLSVVGIIDDARHQALLERSIALYGDYAIRSGHAY